MRSAARATPTMLRVGFVASIAYRGELLVWLLTSTLPLVMLALFGAVAREGPIGGAWDGPALTAYFLATFVVRQLTSSWMAWQINREIREGALSARLLRPVHPLVGYATEALSAMPLRALLALPVAALLVALRGPRLFGGDPALAIAFALSIAGAWLIALSVSCVIGGLALFFQSGVKLMDLWLTGYFVFSGYLVPIALFPAKVRAVVAYLPFRYQIGLPVELLVGAHARGEAWGLLGRQWLFVLLGLAIVRALWKRGLRRHAAFGG